ncbi:MULTISPECIES: hypothetical protein [Microbulbifer]|uniref:hypothetical protein n=1 Tax=Microbulbifer TaxID=48073 RepID=UPI001E50CC47|nr:MULTISPECIES: hypothetical protein [Microbulbifer]UHQ56432.1 hypothetical protein LVE68_05485 [Microbulbifer sp. YPW16]
MSRTLATLAATLLATGIHADTGTESLDQQLVGKWLSQCKETSGRYVQIASEFSDAGRYRARSRFYLDASCTNAMSMDIVSTGRYRLGKPLALASGKTAREIDIDVAEMRSGQMELPGAGQQIQQIIAIVDGRLVFGDAPALHAVTGGARPQKLNLQFYSHKQ